MRNLKNALPLSLGSVATLGMTFFGGRLCGGGNPATDKGDMNCAKLVSGRASSYGKMVNAGGAVTRTFKIRPDARWSDGKAVAAAALPSGCIRPAWKWESLSSCGLCLCGGIYDILLKSMAGRPLSETWRTIV